MNGFTPTTLVTMANGSKKWVGDVAVGDHVLGVTPAGALVATPVIDTKVEPGGMVNPIRLKVLDSETIESRVVTCNSGTGIWLPNLGCYCCAYICTMGEAVLTATLKSLTFLQKEILAGRVLGGAKIVRGAVIFPERPSQDLEYRDHVLASLGWVAGPPLSDIRASDGLRVRGQSRDLLSVEEAFLGWNTDDRRAEIPEDFILTPISMAYWYMDCGELLEADGGRERVRFDCRHLSTATMKRVATCLGAFGILADANDSQGGLIRIRAGDAERFLALVSPYIIPSKQSLLPARYRGLQNFRIPEPELDTVAPLTVKPLQAVQAPLAEVPPGEVRTIITETHNFFAEGVLVSGQP